ncbi:MAG: cytochrome c biogenesis protein CcdA [Bacteroidales bacterium]|nr:cytochrome c biogenesis protein CcdA [Bacteroidales bacterium]
MKKITLLLSFITLVSLSSFGQIFDPVSWSFSYEEVGEGEYDLIFKASIEERSHLYSMDIPDGGPIPTSFTFEESEDFSLVGKPLAMSKGEEHYDDAFSMDIVYYSVEAEFRQRIKTELSYLQIKGFVNFMACDDERCSPPTDVDFDIKIGQQEAASDTENTATLREVKDLESEDSSDRGLLGLFIVSFLLGMAGILTPCVFPMIPMTVAFFSQGTGSKASGFIKALVFALSIVLIYSSLGIIVSLTSAGANFASALSTHWIPNLLFFTLFVVFAASFFGAYEIILPNKWVSGADSKVDKGGIVAAFFLGLTTVLVSFACTGPIVGALLVEAASGDVLRPTIGMFGFGAGFALPFFLFALFPSVMSKLPKSGGWLNSVKVVLGFIMVAFSLKFLSAIDSVYGLGILDRDIFLSIWIVLFFMLGLYLMGKIKFSNDSDIPHFGVFRFVFIIAVFSFTLYLVPGLFGAPLTGISSLIPPKETLSLDLSKTNAGVTTIGDYSATDDGILYADKFHLPYGLKGYFDYEQGMAAAKEAGKPVFLDFKGHACSNCKEMEAKVWSDPQVQKILAEEFIIIALYCDDRTKLPEDSWFTSEFDGKVKNTIGKVNTDLEIRLYNTNTQPLYAITDYDGKDLAGKMEHNLNIQEYIEWMNKGIEAFK